MDWQERPTDMFEVDLGLPADVGSILIMLLERLPVLRRPMRGIHAVTFRAPVGPPGCQAAIFASWGGRIMVRISLRERGGVVTEVTISASGGLGPLVSRRARSVVRDLRRSIEIHAGALRPTRPAT